MSDNWRCNLATFTQCPAPTPPLTRITLARKCFRYDDVTAMITCTICQWSTKDLRGMTVGCLECPHTEGASCELNGDETDKWEYQALPVERSWKTSVPVGNVMNYQLLTSINNVETDGASSQSEITVADMKEKYQPNVNDVIYGAPLTNLTIEQAQMKELDNRRHSFKNWPENAPVSGMSLAEAGFYFIGPSDRVRCAFCRKKVKHWQRGDHPISEHKRISPFCSYLEDY